MDLSFASPTGALTALAIAVPLAALVAFERRARRLRAALRLPQPQARTHASSAAALAGLGLLLALAAAQPVLARTTPQLVRSDAQAYVVLDVSRSMEASLGAGGPTRLERAKRLAVRVRESLPGVPVGVASFTGSVLPHLFPTPREEVFDATVEESVRIDEPLPPKIFLPGERSTDLNSLGDLGANGWFSPVATHRLVVVLTDGESVPVFSGTVASALRNRPPVKTIFVRVSNASDRIALPGGRVDPNYRPDPGSRGVLEDLASATHGRVFSEDDVDAVVRRARADLGQGPAKHSGEVRSRTPLAPWLVLAAALPLGFVLRRRNL